MNSECLRIADQLRRAFAGDPWHGSPLRELLAGITAEQASARPLPAAHTIWELVLHIEIYVDATSAAIHGTPLPKLFDTGKDWPEPGPDDPSAWTAAVESLLRRSAGPGHRPIHR